MEHGQGRREFLAGTGLATLAMTCGGCASWFKLSGGGSMSGYVAPKLKRIRVGVVGVGSRGTYALKRLSFMPGVEVTAFYGITDDGRMLLASGETMYSMTLPER